ncbi:hypothetical protein GZH46_01520 [Fragariocoptes setiger]|uniref:Uncharacterized protein n=1 Tax=Fragariocoptes setiger TaxID=1670756 RepID=A0ABQ7S989_9ACAR|nr:hypothetical protein GZH46_01520 [Fragariocoptes setiger]
MIIKIGIGTPALHTGTNLDGRTTFEQPGAMADGHFHRPALWLRCLGCLVISARSREGFCHIQPDWRRSE